MHSLRNERSRGRLARLNCGLMCVLVAMTAALVTAPVVAQRVKFQEMNATDAAAFPSLGLQSPFTKRVISTTADSAQYVFAADLDGDGDIDILSASRFDDKIAWYENDPGAPGLPPSFTEHVISTNALGAQAVYAAAGDTLGRNVSLSGDTILLGADGVDCTAGSDCGSAYVFRFNGTTWVEQQKLIAPTTDQLRRRGGVCWSHPAFANRHVFARNGEELVCVAETE